MDDALVFGPAPAWSAAFAGTALLAAIAAVVSDAEGRVLAIAVVVAFAALAVADRRASPRLVVDAGGLTVRTPTSTSRLGWDEVDVVRVDERSRWGRTVHALEIDAGERLVVLGARALGADPVTAARRIVAAAPPTRRAALGGGIARSPRDTRDR